MQRYINLTEDCPDGRTCPAVHARADRKAFAMQGRLLSPAEVAAAGITLGPGEVAVELPADVVEEGMDAYRRTAG